MKEYKRMEKVAAFHRALVKISDKWGATPIEVPVQMSSFYYEIGPYLPDDQIVHFDALPEVLAKKAEKYQEGVWRANFVVKPASQLHLLQLGIQPDYEPEYLTIIFSLNKRSQRFSPEHWDVIDEVAMLVGPIIY